MKQNQINVRSAVSSVDQKETSELKRSRSGSAKSLILGFMAMIGLCVLLCHCPGCKTIEKTWKRCGELCKRLFGQPPTRIVPYKEIVDDMRVLWSFERNYAYRNKSLAVSISEMGDGAGIGKDGFVLKSALWAARIDDDNAQPEPLSYKVKNPSTGQNELAKYFFGVFPVKTDTGERDRFSAVIVAVPEKPAEDDVCFIAICGPVNLQNDFSFDKEWPVFQLKAESVVVESIRNLKSSTHTELIQRLKNGDLKNFVTRSFDNLYYPSESKDSDSSSTHKQTKE